MKKIIAIFFIAAFLLPKAKAGSNSFYNFQQGPVGADTPIVVNEVIEDELIEEVIKTKTPPAKDKIQYFSQVTKYGFKNLFTKYSYNPSLAYTAQINPSATTFIQDYMQAHGKYLTKMKGWG